METQDDGGFLPLHSAWAAGDEVAGEQLSERVLGDLRALARRQMRAERADHTLQPTALVNELWLRLQGHRDPTIRSEAAFMALAAKIMRQILVDHARRRGAVKRGAGARGEPLSIVIDSFTAQPLHAAEYLDLDQALQRLEHVDRVASELIQLRFFMGLSVARAAAVTGVSRTTALAKCRVALGYLRERMEDRA